MCAFIKYMIDDGSLVAEKIIILHFALSGGRKCVLERPFCSANPAVEMCHMQLYQRRKKYGKSECRKMVCVQQGYEHE